jgi:hypothetical protein
MIEAEVKTQMNPIYDFNGQVALVTGAAKGMGLATARMFAQSGALVIADLMRGSGHYNWRWVLSKPRRESQPR